MRRAQRHMVEGTGAVGGQVRLVVEARRVDHELPRGLGAATPPGHTGVVGERGAGIGQVRRHRLPPEALRDDMAMAAAHVVAQR